MEEAQEICFSCFCYIMEVTFLPFKLFNDKQL